MNWIHKLVFLIFLLSLPSALSLDVPVVTSSTHVEGEWGGMPMEFRWDAIDGAAKYCYILASTADADIPDDPADCKDALAAYPPQKMSSGDYYFLVKAIAPGEESSSTSYHIKLDIEVPTKPTLSGKAKSDGSIELTWTASEDDASGIKEYEVYKSGLANFDIKDLSARKIASVSGTSYSDSNNLTQNTFYHYRIRPIDVASNAGVVSNEVHVGTAAKCDLTIEFSVALSEAEDSLELGITSDDKIYQGKLVATLPNGSENVFFEATEGFETWSDSFDLGSVDEGYIDFSLTAKEFFGDDCSQEKRFVYDVTGPKISFVTPKYNDKVSEVVVLSVEVLDEGSFKSGIDSVGFFLNESGKWVSLGEGVKGDDSVYGFDWDTFLVENGVQKVKAVATDAGDNSVEAVQSLNVLNSFESALDVNEAIEKASEAREETLLELWALESKAIFSDEAERLFSEADANLSEALALSDLPGLENETNAKLLVAQAMLSYNAAKEVVTVSEYNSADFVFNKEQVGILLNAAGITGFAAQQGQEFIGKYDPGRKLKILKVVDGNATFYRALIEVSFSVDVNILADSNNNDVVLKVIEVVPKQFAEYAVELDSNISYVVLQEDPKLEFSLIRAQYRDKSFVYALKKDLSQQQADALIEGNMVNKFVAPPVLLSPTTTAPIIGLSLELLVFVGAALVILTVVVIAVLFFKKGKLGRKSSLKKTVPKSGLSQTVTVQKKKGPGLISKIKLPSFRKKKNESPLSVFGKK